jgi:hypothetical protein
MWSEIKRDINRARNSVRLLGEIPDPDYALLDLLALSPKSLLGLLISHSQGLSVDGGTIRFLGAEASRLTPGIPQIIGPDFPLDSQSQGFLFAYDICGGLYTCLPTQHQSSGSNLCFYHPQKKEWQFMRSGFGSFFFWCLNGEIPGYKPYLRFEGWEAAGQRLEAGELLPAGLGRVYTLEEYLRGWV